jgi:hypothetical protein
MKKLRNTISPGKNRYLDNKGADMKTLKLLAAALFIAAGASAQQTFERFTERHDLNHDGTIEKKEFNGNPRMFERLDIDNDGSITQDEFDQAMKQRRGQGNRYEQGRNRFSKQGLQPGESIPSLDIFDLKGKKQPLEELWKEKPLVLVTASATCPISVRSCPSLEPLSDAYPAEVNVAVLYIKEAHPAKDANVASQQSLGARTHPQPETFEEKLKLAQLFNDQVKHGNTLYLDGIDDEAANAIGAGPNIGLLIGTDGKIILQQCWYDKGGMQSVISDHLRKTTAETPPDNP